jgi:hypothetical protein
MTQNTCDHSIYPQAQYINPPLQIPDSGKIRGEPHPRHLLAGGTRSEFRLIHQPSATSKIIITEKPAMVVMVTRSIFASCR